MNKIVGDIVLFMDIMNLILCQWRHLLAKKQLFTIGNMYFYGKVGLFVAFKKQIS